MIITLDQTKQLISNGAALIIDGSTMPVVHLKQLAAEAKSSKVAICIKNVNTITFEQLNEIAQVAPGWVTFDLTTGT